MPFRSALTCLIASAATFGCGRAVPAGAHDASAMEPAAISEPDGSADAGGDAADPDAASDGPNDAARPGLPDGCALIINEIQTGGAAATDELVEIYRTCDDELWLSGFRLVYTADVGTSEYTRVLFDGLHVAAGDRFIVCANAAYAGAADVRFVDGLRAEGGGVGIRASDGRLLDSVGWGTAANVLVEGAPADAPPAGLSIARTPDGADTGVNKYDFVLGEPSPGATNVR